VRNLQHTTTPSKESVKGLVSKIQLKDAKPKMQNVLKKSHNEEASIFSKQLGIGASGETNLIFSQRSYLPRAASANLTLELFGNTMNLIEVGV
jgi:hypothetical protein